MTDEGLRQLNPGEAQGVRVYDSDGVAPALGASQTNGELGPRVMMDEAVAIRQGWGNSRESIRTDPTVGALTGVTPLAMTGPTTSPDPMSDPMSPSGASSAADPIGFNADMRQGKPRIDQAEPLGVHRRMHGLAMEGSTDLPSSADPTAASPLPPSGQAASLAKTSAWPASEPGSGVIVPLWGSSTSTSSTSTDPLGSFSRMSQVSLAPLPAATLGRSSVNWRGWATGGPSGWWTRDGSESPNGAVASSLSRVLLPRTPLRFYLSPRAGAGILRRAARRGRELPEKLMRELWMLVAQDPSLTAATWQAIQVDAAARAKEVGPSRSVPTVSRAAWPSAAMATTSDRTMTAPSSSTRDRAGTSALWEPSEVAAAAVVEASPSPSLPTDSRVAIDDVAPTLQAASSPNRGGTSGPLVLPSTASPDALSPLSTTSPGSTPTTPTPSTPSIEGMPEPSSSSSPTRRPGLIRRLTPVECERLQGFPDGWTIPTA